MLEPLLGSIYCEKILFFLYKRNEGYLQEIAEYYAAPATPIKKQLERMEAGSVLYSKTVGRTRIYAINPRYPFYKELIALILKAIEFLSDVEIASLTKVRTRPRRKDKPFALENTKNEKVDE